MSKNRRAHNLTKKVIWISFQKLFQIFFLIFQSKRNKRKKFTWKIAFVPENKTLHLIKSFFSLLSCFRINWLINFKFMSLFFLSDFHSLRIFTQIRTKSLLVSWTFWCLRSSRLQSQQNNLFETLPFKWPVVYCWICKITFYLARELVGLEHFFRHPRRKPWWIS